MSEKSLFSGNCQVRCCLFQLPHLHHCSSRHACLLWLMCLLSIEDFGKIQSSLYTMLHLCRDALVGQKLRLLSFWEWSCFNSSTTHPFPVGRGRWAVSQKPKKDPECQVQGYGLLQVRQCNDFGHVHSRYHSYRAFAWTSWTIDCLQKSFVLFFLV